MQEPMWLRVLLAVALLVLMDLVRTKRKLGETELRLNKQEAAWLSMNSQRYKLETANKVRRG